MTEPDLAGLGVHRLPIPVPFPQAGGPVNVYLVEEEDGGLLMFDAGLGSDDGIAALEAGFARLGRRFDEVRRILISHGHIDHYGAAHAVLERAGRDIPVFAHAADLPKVAQTGRSWKDVLPPYDAYLVKLGVPREWLQGTWAYFSGTRRLAKRLPRVNELRPGEVLRTRRLTLEVMHMPGHTPGLCCLHDRDQRLFFANDHLLEKVSPNPLIELGPNGEEDAFQPLVAYIESIGRVRALDIDLVLPGHGPPFSGHREVIDRLLQFYGRRQGRIREELVAGPRTAYEVAQALFPAMKPSDTFLVLSETVANLEVLVQRGDVVRRREGELYRFALSAAA